MQEYYLGLDMGTSSVGWAVTDKEYNLLRFKQKDMWGIREFDEADTAAARRAKRIARRSRQREQVRIGLLQSYFDEAIREVDQNFFARLDNSKYHLEDKDSNVRTPNGVFNDKNYKDRDYIKDYPTIFHLRKALIENSAPQDVRLVYLALLNMFKHRGHFLNASLNADNMGGEIASVFYELQQMLSEKYNINLLDIETEILNGILKDRSCSRSVRAEKLAEKLAIEKRDKKRMAVVKALCGLKVDANSIFVNGEDEDDSKKEKAEFCFEDSGYEDKTDELLSKVGEDGYEVIEQMKRLYDIGAFNAIMDGERFLSFARVKSYEKHKQDLAMLKRVVKEYGTEGDYNKLFRLMEPGSYSAYVNSTNSKEAETGGETVRRRNVKGRAQEDLYKAIETLLKTFPGENEKIKYILSEINNETFLPKQLTSSNGVIPNQVHAYEMKAILKNAEEYLPFLKEKDESGLSVSERILELFKFRVPYYVGPVTENSQKAGGNGWVIRKEAGQVLPWNINEKIDMDRTNEEFIKRLIRECTYIKGAKVLPKSSLLYEKFCVLNEINNIKIEDRRITVELKQEIFNNLFLKGKKVSKKQLVAYLMKVGAISDESQLSGIDKELNNVLTSYRRYYSLFGDEIKKDAIRNKVESIIETCTIYGENKADLQRRLRSEYQDLNDEQIKCIIGFKHKDWGRFSKDFLEFQGVDAETGELDSLVNMLWNNNLNLMEIINSNRFSFMADLQKKRFSSLEKLSDIKPDVLDEYYFSAPVKRMIWQTLLIIKEIEKIMKSAPARVFVEMTRTDEEKGDKGRKASRKDELLKLYKNVKDEMHHWQDLIEAEDASGRLKSKKMYLYLRQMGRDMYTGKEISLDDLFNDNLYDIDHIYPRHFVKDDNINNNLVLVYKPENARKSDIYPLDASIRLNKSVQAYWLMLKEKHFITEEKYRRLTGSNPFSEEQQADFIARQMVETSQGTKGVADFLKDVLTDTEIVYSKARNVSDFRRDFAFPKSRLINDFHHAQDAYLNIVVGNVYYTKFTSNPRNFIRNDYGANPDKHNYNLGRMFEKDVVRGDYCAWVAPEDKNADKKTTESGTISTVRRMMAKTTPLLTRMNYVGKGGFADETVYGKEKAGNGTGYLPLKQGDERLRDVSKYGGLTKASVAYFFLVEHTVKKKRIKTLETVPVILNKQIGQSLEKLQKYCEDDLELKDAKILFPRIKLHSLMKWEGFYFHITGKTGNQICIRNAVELVLSPKWVSYISMLEKEGGTTTKAENEALYGEFVKKHREGIYRNRPNPVGDKLLMREKEFAELSNKEQIYVLKQVLLLSAIGTGVADLKALSEAKSCGVALVGKNLMKCKEVKLITQSPTGLFEKEIDLLAL